MHSLEHSSARGSSPLVQRCTIPAQENSSPRFFHLQQNAAMVLCKLNMFIQVMISVQSHTAHRWRQEGWNFLNCWLDFHLRSRSTLVSILWAIQLYFAYGVLTQASSLFVNIKAKTFRLIKDIMLALGGTQISVEIFVYVPLLWVLEYWLLMKCQA